MTLSELLEALGGSDWEHRDALIAAIEDDNATRNSASESADAKIAELQDALNMADQALEAAKAHNYDLLMQIPATDEVDEVTPETDDEVEDIIRIDDLFSDKDEGSDD